jgi:hypothetical protein
LREDKEGYSNADVKKGEKKGEKNDIKNDIKILHLVNIVDMVNMSNKNIYNMYKMTRNYYDLTDDMGSISTYYYGYMNDMNVEIKDDIILVPRKYNKLIKSLDITRGMEYDYVLISDITSLVNISLLIKYLEKNKMDYGGSYMKEDKYIDGKGIIMSKKLVDYMLDRIYDTYDTNDKEEDRMIGKFVREYTDIVPKTMSKNVLFVDINNIKRIRKNLKDTIFYINNNRNKITDLKRIEIIINKLIYKHEGNSD